MSLKDLISKKAVIQAINDDERNGMWSSFMSHEDAEDFKKEIKKLSPAFAGMTNGEVIETLFPNCIDYKGAIEVKTTLDMGKLFRRSWWDSPYKKGGV